MERKIGKLQTVYFGHGGYQDACLGLNVTLSGKGWGICDSNTAWDANMIKHSEHFKWTEEDRNKQYAEIMHYVSGLLADAKVSKVSELKGKPIEATFDGQRLKSWRILTEAI